MTKFLQVLAVLFAELSIGMTLVGATVPLRVVQGPFYTVTSLLSAVAGSAAMLLLMVAMPGCWLTGRWLGLTVISAGLAYGCFRLERRDAGRFLFVVAGASGLLMGLLPLSDDLLAQRELTTRIPYLFAASTLIGTLLLGAASVGAFFSFWSWMFPGLARQHLVRLVQIILGVAAARALLLITMLVGLSRLDPKLSLTFFPTLWAEDILLFVLRVLTGVVAPAVCAAIALRHVRENNDAAAMRWLLGLTGSTIVGETLAAFLLI